MTPAVRQVVLMRRRATSSWVFASARAAAVQARATALGSPLADDLCELLDEFCVSAESLLLKGDRLRLPFDTSTQSLINICDPTGLLFVPVNGPTFTARRGWKGSIANSAYLDPQFTEGAGTQSQQNSSSHGGHIQDTAGTANGTVRQIGGNTLSFIQHNSAAANGASARNHFNATKTYTLSPIAAGHIMTSRGASATYDIYRNGVSAATATQTSQANPYPWFDLASTASATPTVPASFTDIATSYFWIGGYLTAAEVASLYYALNAFLAGVGADTLATMGMGGSMAVS